MLLTAVNPSCRRSAVHVQPHARKTPARRLASNSSFALMQSLCPLNVSPTCRLLRQFVGQ